MGYLDFLAAVRVVAGSAQRAELAPVDGAVARRMRCIFVHSRNAEVKVLALQATLLAAVELNRFAAMNVFNALLASIQDAELALLAVEMLQAELKYCQRVAEQVPPGRLHAAICEFQARFLSCCAPAVPEGRR